MLACSQAHRLASQRQAAAAAAAAQLPPHAADAAAAAARAAASRIALKRGNVSVGDWLSITVVCLGNME